MNAARPCDRALRLALAARRTSASERDPLASLTQTMHGALALALEGHDEATVSAYLAYDALTLAPGLEAEALTALGEPLLATARRACTAHRGPRPETHEARYARIIARARDATPESTLLLCTRALAHLRLQETPQPAPARPSPAQDTASRFYLALARLADSRALRAPAAELRNQTIRVYPHTARIVNPDALPHEGNTPVIAYCDGSCLTNPGPGGWAAILHHRDETTPFRELHGAQAYATNNEMELLAAIKAIQAVPRTTALHIVTDSQYVARGANEWLSSWKRHGWKNRRGTPVKNRPLWQQLDAHRAIRDLTFRWVRAHAGNPGNERADALARAAARHANTPSNDHPAAAAP